MSRITRASKKKRRYFELARRIAYNSNYGKMRHGAVLVKGGSVINVSFNKDMFSAFGGRFREGDCTHATQHAEIGCILGLPRSATNGSTIYVVRINKEGEFRMSKPCPMCESVLDFVGVKRAVYTIGEGRFDSHKIGRENDG